MWKRLQQAVAQREDERLTRSFRGKNRGIDFCSNDYLGLAGGLLTLPTLPSGSAASRLISGYSESLKSFENELALRYEAEQALVFHSGFEANSGLFGMLASLGVRVLYDEHIHSSIRHALRVAKSPAWSFRHNDLNDLETKLKKAGQDIAVVTESLFSMNGDCGDLTGIAALKSRYDFAFIVDEAHGTGTLGGFTGLTGNLELLDAVDVRIHTFGKALGAQGACIAGTALLGSALTQFCQPLIYSTAPAPLLVELMRQSHLTFEREASGRQAELKKNISSYLKLVNDHARFSQNESPIQWFSSPGNTSVIELSDRLQEVGFDIVAIRKPTVPEGSERLRICLHAFNSEKEISRLVSEILRIH